AMADSGDTVDLSSIAGIKVDKHSSGGVADTTTIVLAPLVAACGGKVAKMSGRGLGHTGGTLDKLESIPGYNVHQSMEDFARIVNMCGASVIGQTASLAPADGKLYALRDVTSTVDSMPLIASSIMSKKLAAGSDKILLDVKWGTGAFLPALESAVELARIMVEIGKHAKKPTKALVTDMNQPLGNAVGNALEIREALQILRNEIRTGALRELVLLLAEEMLVMGEIYPNLRKAQEGALEALESGKALEKFGEIIALHGGNPGICEDDSLLPRASEIVPVKAEKSGYLVGMNTSSLGIAAGMLGAGRERKGDPVDPAVGFWMHRRLGDFVERGELLAEFHVNDPRNKEAALELFLDSLLLGEEPPEELSLVAERVE
ncbi:MAG TPA: thymidine phosphorylase, partial [Synergistaceae bacterium]|nr:thymidine phosphorylase [Synergistaceae bacterium]